MGKLLQQAIGRIVFAHLSDPRIDPARTSITRVQVQEDLLRAKVFVSVLGEEARQRRAVEALSHAGGRIQALLRDQVQLRIMPALEFRIDEQFKGTLKTFEIIRRAMQEIQAKDAARAGDDQSRTEPAQPVRDEKGCTGPEAHSQADSQDQDQQ